MKVLSSVFALALAVAVPAEAQLTLEISEGRVTLDAVNVPARQILAEWARIGGTKIVGSEKITGAPLTLKLVAMPEKQALDIILRNVAGFMAAPRQASAVPGASTYDRILIMATSSAPAPTANNNPRAAAPNATATRRVPPRPPNLPPVGGDDPPQDDQRVDDDQADNGVNDPPVFTFPAPAAGQPGNPVFVPMPANGQPGTAPVITLQPGQNGPAIYNFVPAEGGQPVQQPQSTPTFGVIGAPSPGMIQVPQQPQPNITPVRPVTRPPGS